MEKKNVQFHPKGAKVEKDGTPANNNNQQNSKKSKRIRKTARSQTKKLLPVEEKMHSTKPVDKELMENTMTIKCEIEKICAIKMKSDSNLSTVYTAENRITNDVLDVNECSGKETTTNSSLPSPVTSFTPNNEEETSIAVGKEPSLEQQSVKNSMGKKVYLKSFMLKFESAACCQKKPDCLLNNWDNITKSSNPLQCSSMKKTESNFILRSRLVSGLMPSYSKFTYGFHRGVIPQTQSAIVKRDVEQEKITSKSKVVHKCLSSNNEVELNRTENAWIPSIAAKKAASSTNAGVTNVEVTKNVISILNKITPDNIVVLTKSFVALPINTIERLENTIDLVFEKAIQEQNFAPLYAAVCSAMQSIRVNCVESQKITSFKVLIIKKCQRFFESDKTQQIDSVKKLVEINSCEDPEKKNELQLEYEEIERRLRKRSVGNCRFIGELFKQKMINPKIMLYCITNLVSQHSEEPLECLCNLFKTTGKELEQCCNLDETFNKLEALTSNKSKSKISSRIKFMIQDVMDLRKDKWLPRRLDNKPKMIKEIEEEVRNEEKIQSMATYKFEKKQLHNRVGNKIRGGDNINHRENNRNIKTNTKYEKHNYTFDQRKLRGMKELSLVTALRPSTKWTFPSSPENSKKLKTLVAVVGVANELVPKNDGPAVSRPSPNSKLASADISKNIVTNNSQVELDSEMEDKIHTLCKIIMEEYEQMHNLDDIIYSLVEDKNSCIRTRHQQFVTSIVLITLNGKPNSRTEAGKMFAELLSKKILPMTAITRGIDTVLKDWNDQLTDYPHFFSYVAAIVAPLLISKTASFEYFNLKYACASIRPDNSSVFFVEVLQMIFRFENTENVQNDFGGTLRTYNMWRMQSKYVPLDVFISDNQINKCFKNDQLGVLLLSMSIYDKTRLIDDKPLVVTTHKWIRKNINAEIIKLPCFIRTLTISTAIVCSNKPKDDLNEDFFDRGYSQLLNYFIRSVSKFSASEIQEREVQCIKGSQIISTILREQQNSDDTALRPFYELYRDRVISKESLDAWKDEEEFDENPTKTAKIAILSSIFLALDIKK